MVRAICLLIFRLTGWTFVNQVPEDLRSFVFIGAPHTSNYDFIPAMAVAALLKRNAKFVIKSEWLKFPFNLILKPAGAIGIDRKMLKEQDRASNTDAIAGLFKKNFELVLMIAPEGTRGPNENWKSGFYYIAQKAGVPIVLGYGDYAKKEAGLGKVIYPKNFEEDMKLIMDFYRPIQGKMPANFIPDKRF